MNAYYTILLTQGGFEVLSRIKRIVTSGIKSIYEEKFPIIEGIDHFPTETRKTRRALLALVPSAWLAAVKQFPNIQMFNYIGLTYEVVKALNENGYVVDIVHYAKSHVPKRDYELYIGHGGNSRTTIENLNPATPIFQYVSGAYWEAFNRESAERYQRFADSRKLKQVPEFRRAVDSSVNGEQYLADHADCLITINCPRMVDTFGELQNKFFFTGFGAYPDEAIHVIPADRDFSEGRKGFIYVGGTNGNIQKGLDVLLEAFSRCPDLRLYIYCRVEEEVLSNYKGELSLGNIHYIYHLKHPQLRRRLQRILKKVNFTVHVPINSGMGTAFMGSLAHGFIPSGYVDLPPHGDCSVVTDNWDVDSIMDCITRASRMPADWCEVAHGKVIDLYQEICGTESLRTKLREAFSDEHTSQLRARKRQGPQGKSDESPRAV
jgi:hypothetical protein